MYTWAEVAAGETVSLFCHLFRFSALSEKFNFDMAECSVVMSVGTLASPFFVRVKLYCVRTEHKLYEPILLTFCYSFPLRCSEWYLLESLLSPVRWWNGKVSHVYFTFHFPSKNIHSHFAKFLPYFYLFLVDASSSLQLHAMHCLVWYFAFKMFICKSFPFRARFENII